MNNNLSIINLHFGEHAISHCDLQAGRELKSLWFEIPEFCHLYCDYCFASTNSNNYRNKISKKRNEYLQWNDYENLLRDFAAAGGEFIGIPGRGEPFHPYNIDLTKRIILIAQELKLKTTIFTTGETIFFKPKYSEKNVLDLDSEPDFELMNFLLDKDIVILIKWNSDKEEIQDRIVHTKNYTKLRERALNLLIKNKFNQENTPKLGIVTSILKDNIDEIVGLFQKYKKEKGLIFDCDTILPRGRGEQYFNREDNLTHNQLSEVFGKLKDEGAILTCQGGTYVGESCDRILHHLYVELKGNVYPCIGCFENKNSKDFYLGNIKHSSITELWNHPKRRKLREQTKEAFTGVCFNCQNFEDNTCYSCLGRCVSKVDATVNDLLIDTHGCTNHCPKLVPWISKTTDYIRKILSFEETKSALNSNLENLWKPNQNLAFVLNQLPEHEKSKEVLKIIKVDDAHNNEFYKPGEVFKKVPVKKFSLKKHFKYSDLDFPTNKVWDFIDFPVHNIEDPDEYDATSRSKLIRELSKSFLSNIFLPSIKLLFDKYDQDKNILICNLLFYDNQNQKYFYRTISKNEVEKDGDFDISLILFRWAEDIDGNNYFSDNSQGKIFNLSNTFRNDFYRNYELILNDAEDSQKYRAQKHSNVFLLYPLISCDLIKEKADKLNGYLKNLVNDLSSEWYQIKKLFNGFIFNDLTNDEREKIKTYYRGLNKLSFYDKNEINSQNPMLFKAIKEFINLNIAIENINDNSKDKLKEDISTCTSLSQINNILLKDDDFKKSNRSLWEFTKLMETDSTGIANYLIFLRFLHDKFAVNHYLLTHSTNFKASSFKNDMSEEETASVFGEVTQPSGILLCSKEPLCRDLQDEMELFLSNALNPFDEFYFTRLYGKIQADRQFKEKIEAHRHTLLNLVNSLEPYRNNLSDNSTFLKQGIKYAFIVAEDICSRKENRDRVGLKLSEKPEVLLREICTFFKANCNSTLSLEESIEDTSITLNPTQRIDFITTMYNLIHNAEKSDSYKSFNGEFRYKLNTKLLNNVYEIVIINPAIIRDNILKFINLVDFNPNTYQYNEVIKPSGGLAIIKRIISDNERYGWRIEAQTDIKNKETKIRFKILA
jgi:radical SAM protein with 4Fe4S-binding SPASM domain